MAPENGAPVTARETARRGFLMTSLVAGYTLATGGPTLAAIRTGADGLQAGPTAIPVGDGHLPGYYARPAGNGAPPVVLVIEEIFGVHEYIRDVCRRLGHLGYMAIAPELYARIADLSTMSDPQQIVRDVILQAPDAQLLADLDHTAGWAAQLGGDANRLGCIGFCRGGRDTWLYAEHSARLRAAVAFYGPVAGPTSAIQQRNPIDLAASLHAPLLGLYGGQDTSIKLADVQRAAGIARHAGRTVDIFEYPDAGHGFHADYRASYNPRDAADAWSRAIAWLRRYGV